VDAQSSQHTIVIPATITSAVPRAARKPNLGATSRKTNGRVQRLTHNASVMGVRSTPRPGSTRPLVSDAARA